MTKKKLLEGSIMLGGAILAIVVYELAGSAVVAAIIAMPLTAFLLNKVDPDKFR